MGVELWSNRIGVIAVSTAQQPNYWGRKSTWSADDGEFQAAVYVLNRILRTYHGLRKIIHFLVMAC